MARILLLADCNSAHTQKWAIALSKQNYNVGIFSFQAPRMDWYSERNIQILNEKGLHKVQQSSLKKLNYFLFLNHLKKAIQIFKPDVLHAHYASSYGLLGALSNFHPFFISVWGSDVMEFPQKNKFNKLILSYSLKKADALCATSLTIERYLKQYTNKSINIIPFGIDLKEFKPQPFVSESNSFTFGCAKGLEKKYNIHLLIEAFAELTKKYPTKLLKLIIIGDGSERKNLEQLSITLGVQQQVVFTGQVPSWVVSSMLNELNVLVNISTNESFGVNVLEAMACGKPVIVSKAEGLQEIVSQTQGNDSVEITNVHSISNSMEHYLLSPEDCASAGKSGLELVKKMYNFSQNLAAMIHLYGTVLK